MRTPRVLRLDIHTAIQRLEDSMRTRGVDGEWMDLLRLYRQWWPARPGMVGLMNGLGLLDHELVAAPPREFRDRPGAWALLAPRLQSLDEAFKRHHAFKPEDFVSDAVVGVIQSRRARRSRNRRRGETGAGRWSTPEARNLEIGDWLANCGYATSSDKESLIDRAMRHFDVNETAVRNAARAAGLTRSYRKRAGRK